MNGTSWMTVSDTLPIRCIIIAIQVILHYINDDPDGLNFVYCYIIVH